MKILLDKVDVYPPHALCRADVRLIFSSVPAKWSEHVAVTRLSASRASHVALYNRYDKILTISSRGWSKEETLRRVRVELAAHASGFKRRTFQSLQERYKPEIEKLIVPLVEELLPKLSQKKIWLGSSSGREPMKDPPFLCGEGTADDGLRSSRSDADFPRQSPKINLSHLNITMPKGGEAAARVFYQDLLGLPEIPKPESLRGRGGVWFSAGGSDLHLSVEENRLSPDACRHFGLECADVPELRARLTEAGVKTEDGRPAPWQRFFVSDPFGNRIEIHEAGAFRA